MWEQTFQAYDENQKNVAKFENTRVKQTTKSRFLDKQNKSCVLSNIYRFLQQQNLVSYHICITSIIKYDSVCTSTHKQMLRGIILINVNWHVEQQCKFAIDVFDLFYYQNLDIKTFSVWFFVALFPEAYF